MGVTPPGRLLVDGRDVAPLDHADTYMRRLRGMLGRVPTSRAMLFRPGNSVHGFGMTRTLDVAQLDADMTVLHVARLRPGRVVGPRRHTCAVLEASEGCFASWGLGVGSRLTAAPR